MLRSDLYITKPSGFSQEIDDTIISQMLHQPTPKGGKLLCAYYSAKYNINLSYLDLRGKISRPDSAYRLFEYLVKIKFIDNLADGTNTGIILSHGQFHAIPVLIKKQGGISKIVAFDSTSGPRTKGYFRIASLFNKSAFYLNSGSRQADSSSCITDAICILKEALQIDELFTLLDQKRYDNHPALLGTKSRFISTPKPNNFFLFKMPEKLLLTAQRTAYVTDAEANTSVKLRGGKTLKEYRDLFQMQVSLMEGNSVTVKGINSYLFIKSRQHRLMLDQRSNLLQAIQEKQDDHISEQKLSHF